MSTKTRIRGALLLLATEKPVDEIRLKDIAERAGVSLPSVRKHTGGKKGLANYISVNRIETFGDNRDVKQRILDAAQRALADGDFNSTSLDDIADYAGVTKGAIYHHFKNKDALLLSLSEQRIWRYLGRIIAVSGTIDGDLASRFEKICRSLWENIEPGERAIPLMPSQLRSSRDEELRLRAEQIERRVVQFFAHEIASGQQAGGLAQYIDPDAAGMLLWSVMQQIDHLYRTADGTRAVDEVVGPLTNILARALAP